MKRTERLTSRVLGPKNSLWYWNKSKNPLIICVNFVVIYLCKYIPSFRMKNALYRMLGCKIGNHVSIGLGVTFDIFFPEMIEIDDNTIIGFNCTIVGHEFLQKELRTGKVRIGKNVLIGMNSSILPGVHIGDGATVSAMSLVNHDVPAKGFVGGVPAKKL